MMEPLLSLLFWVVLLSLFIPLVFKHEDGYWTGVGIVLKRVGITLFIMYTVSNLFS